MPSATAMNEQSTVFLVTGANQGLGYETVKMLAQKEILGYRILLASRDLERGEEAAAKLKDLGLKGVQAIQLDVTDDESIGRAVERVEREYGKLDVLINNAAILTDPKVSPTYSVRTAFQDSFGTNVSSVAVLTEAFLPLLAKSSLPRIVFVSSRAGSLTFSANQTGKGSYTSSKYLSPAYYTSKAALNMLMVLYANRFKEQGWKVNATCPGFRPTALCSFDENAGRLEDGVVNAVRLATLGVDGETGTFSNLDGPLEW